MKKSESKSSKVGGQTALDKAKAALKKMQEDRKGRGGGESAPAGAPAS